MPNEEKREFTFIKEQIKIKPFYKRKWFTRGMAGIGMAVVFGGTAGITFAMVKPWAQKQFGDPQTPQQIVIAQDETEMQEQSQTDTQAVVPDETETETHTESESQEPERIIEKKELELYDYKKLYTELYKVANEASKSIVTVTGESSDVDWSNQVDESQLQVSGLIIAGNDQNYYVLTESRVVEYAQSICVTFQDGTTASASLQKEDDVTGSAVLTIPVSSVFQSTRDSIQVAELGNSGNVRQGTPVISIGSPLGYSTSMVFGMVTTVSRASAVDSQYSLLTTDIIGSSQSSGILVDLDGNIIGIISQNFSEKNAANVITALGISDMKYLLEAMSNNKDIPYLGIIGYEINEAVSRQNGVPKGIYIKEVETDSPAMHIGIQMGIDILTEIQGKEVLTMEDYMTQLRRYKPGQVLRIKYKRRGIDGYVEFEESVVLKGK